MLSPYDNNIFHFSSMGDGIYFIFISNVIQLISFSIIFLLKAVQKLCVLRENSI